MRLLALATLVLGLAACGGADVTTPNGSLGGTTPSTIEAASTRTLTGTAGAALTPLPTVKVTNQGGTPLSGVTVTWTAGGGSRVTRSASLTDGNGLATPGAWTAGNASGTQTLDATVASLPAVRFTATVSDLGGPSRQ